MPSRDSDTSDESTHLLLAVPIVDRLVLASDKADAARGGISPVETGRDGEIDRVGIFHHLGRDRGRNTKIFQVFVAGVDKLMGGFGTAGRGSEHVAGAN